MTERKPPGVGFESWVDRQIREATERGDFQELSGLGEPLREDTAPYDDLWWVKGKMHREGIAPVLPPALALRKEAEDALEAVRGAASEAQVRRIVAGINEKIEAAIRRPPAGPPLRLTLFDADALVAEWRSRQD